MALPRYIAIKPVEGEKYLRFVNEDVEAHGFLQFSGEEVVSPYTKLEVEPAKCGNGLVHLRCCYNNKYFVRLSETESEHWIVCAANEPEEDQSKWSCTLFKPEYVDDENEMNTNFRFRLIHVQLGFYVSLSKNIADADAAAAAPATFTDCLIAGSKEPDDEDLRDVFSFYNWNAYVILPRHVAFKGDNGLYLKAYWNRGRQHLQYSSDDIGDDLVRQEVFHTSNGRVRILNNHWNTWWTLNNREWIVASVGRNHSDRFKNESLFLPIKVDDNVIALRNLGNNLFCRSWTAGPLRRDMLTAYTSTITNVARIEVEETVLRRQITNVNYNLKDARVYNERVFRTPSQEIVNRTQQPIEGEMTFTYEEHESTSWSKSMSLRLGMSFSLTAGVPSMGVGMEIGISAETERQSQWGETKSSTTTTQFRYTATVPPMTKLTANLLVTTPSYDIPFSYTQRDLLTTGQTATFTMNDGIFTGTNTIKSVYKAEEKVLN